MTEDEKIIYANACDGIERYSERMKNMVKNALEHKVIDPLTATQCMLDYPTILWQRLYDGLSWILGNGAGTKKMLLR